MAHQNQMLVHQKMKLTKEIPDSRTEISSRRTRSSAWLSSSESSSVLQKFDSARRPRKNAQKGHSAVTDSREMLKAENCAETTTVPTDTDHDLAAEGLDICPATYKPRKQKRRGDNAVTRIPGTDVCGHDYKHRNKGIFTDNLNSAGTPNFDCVLRSYYQTLFSYSPVRHSQSDLVRSDPKSRWSDQCTETLPRTFNYVLRDRHQFRRSRAQYRENVPQLPNIDRALRGEQNKEVKDTPSRTQVLDQGCQTLAEKKLFSDSMTQTQNFALETRSDWCKLKKRKQSLTENLARAMDLVFRLSRCWRKDSLVQQHSTSAPSNDDTLARSRRRVVFRDCDVNGQGKPLAEIMGDVESPSGQSVSDMELSEEGLHSEDEEAAEEEDQMRMTWDRSTTIILGVAVGLRLLYDAWSDNLGVVPGADILSFLGNKSLIKLL